MQRVNLDKLEGVLVAIQKMTNEANTLESVNAALALIRAVPKRAKPKDLLGDYPINVDARRIVWPSPVMQVDYADGTRVRMSFATLPGKPLNVGRGFRVCAAAYQQRKKTLVLSTVAHWQVETQEGVVLASGVGAWLAK